ncbi:MAG: glycosyltransferase family 2 protein [Clostridia bacterium]|nr:glycosyltransferase family 2 protein [Clostridia bacterium]
MYEKNILVSVICTAYNHEKYIRSALDGFVMQKTDFAFEVLIHDDASTDKTAEIIKEYAEKYPNIISPILQTENQHSKKISITNTFLLPKAKGKYIAFCEGDDFWTDENKLQIQVKFLENNPDYIACVHNTTFHDCSGRKKDGLVVQKNDEHDVLFEDIVWGMGNAYQTSSLVVRKEYVNDMPDFYYTALNYGFGDFPRAIWYTIVGKVRFFPYNMSTYRYISTPTSWSASDHSIPKLIKQREGIIAMFKQVKGHVSYERQELVERVITEQKFYSLDLQKRYKEMFAPEFSNMWKKESFIYRLKIYVKMYCPWIYTITRKSR